MTQSQDHRFRTAFFLLALILSAFLIRIAFLPSARIIETDGCGYVRLAQLCSGKAIAGTDRAAVFREYALGYPLGISLAHLCIPDWEKAGRIVSLVCGALLPGMIFAVARYLFGNKVAFWAALLVVADPVLVAASTRVLTEMSFSLALTAAFIVSLFFFAKPAPLYSFSLGIIWGICYLIKPEAIVWALPHILAMLSGVFYRRNVSQKKRWGFAALSISGLSIVCGIYVLYGYYLTGEFSLIPNKANALSSLQMNALGGSFEEVFYSLNGGLWAPKVSGIFDLMRGYARNLYYFVPRVALPQVILLPLGIFIILGIFRSPWDRDRLKKELPFWLLVLFPVFFYPLFPISERRFVPVLPLLMIPAAKGIDEFGEWWLKTFGARKIGLWTAAAVIFLSFVPRLTGPFRESDIYAHEPIEYREAGRWMADHLAPGSTVMSRAPEIAFYAGARWIPLPFAAWDEVIAEAGKRKVDYIVLERYSALLRPDFRDFMTEDAKIPGAKLVYRWNRKPEYKVLILQLEKSLTGVPREGMDR
jgi:hypothetical protein